MKSSLTWRQVSNLPTRKILEHQRLDSLNFGGKLETAATAHAFVTVRFNSSSDSASKRLWSSAVMLRRTAFVLISDAS